ncbi:hypothetical protein JMN32_17540 [Fulvivirga sp. 29W222]|uniref:Uncharacterized protein n=1 Tax=Fulvivirga marina TaxID=2494733 RepID=A0A937KCG4_9BACT|nr:hypothetical protein [Fulvivirga marina]MBL6448126.1 hypothetical protein [Fulvivirga marina]
MRTIKSDVAWERSRVRGPHIRYIVTAIFIAFVMAMLIGSVIMTFISVWLY